MLSPPHKGSDFLGLGKPGAWQVARGNSEGRFDSLKAKEEAGLSGEGGGSDGGGGGRGEMNK